MCTPKKNKPASRPQICILSAIAASLITCSTAVAASPYSSSVFFGDSLTDAGYFENFFGQQASRTTNPDQVWAFHLARALGTSAQAAAQITWGGVVQKKGTNHAVSGARVQRQDGYPMPLVASFITPVKTQVKNLIDTSGTLDPKALYAVWAGANDVLAYANDATDALADPVTQAAAARSVVEKSAAQASAVVDMVHSLHAAGAQTVMLLNLPDMGTTPLARQTGAEALLSTASRQFNTALLARMGPVKQDLIMLNVQDMLAEVVQAPATFGLRNVTAPACTSLGLTGSVDAGSCTADTLVEADAASTYLFADSLHPTGAGHALLGDYAVSVIRAPKQMGLLAEAPLNGSAWVMRSIQQRMDDANRAPGTRAFAAYAHGNHQLRAGDDWQPGYRNGVDALTIGVDHNAGDRLLIGAAVTHAEHGASLGQRAGRFDLGQTLISVYGQYRVGDWRAGLDASAGHLNFHNIRRNVRLGAAHLQERGNTQGNHAAVRVSTAYDIPLGTLTLSPNASVAAQRISVSGFTESRAAGTATSMHFEAQTRHALVTRVGLSAKAAFDVAGTSLQPFADIAWEREHTSRTRSVRANVRDMVGSFSHVAYRPDRSTTVAGVGLNAAWGKRLQTQVGYSGRYGSQARAHTIEAGIKYVF